MNTFCGALSALATSCLLSATALASPANGDEYMSYSGTATALHSNEFLYGEKHVLVDHDGKLAQRVVLYTCRNGSAFARKTVSYVDPLAPNFVLEDASDGMRHSCGRRGPNGLLPRRRRRSGEKRCLAESARLGGGCGFR
jgi:hemin uptake protein HemP